MKYILQTTSHECHFHKNKKTASWDLLLSFLSKIQGSNKVCSMRFEFPGSGQGAQHPGSTSSEQNLVLYLVNHCCCGCGMGCGVWLCLTNSGQKLLVETLQASQELSVRSHSGLQFPWRWGKLRLLHTFVYPLHLYYESFRHPKG